MYKKLAYILIIAIFFGCNSQSAHQPLDKTNFTKANIADPIDSTINSSVPTDYSDSLNFIDAEGLKQGKHIRKWNGKLVEEYTYINDTLNGHYESDHGEGYYINGKKDGLQFTYYGDKESILMVNLYNNGTHIWGGFPTADSDYLIPVKGFNISKDSTYIEASYSNGEIWYQGYFCLLPDSVNNGQIMTCSYGIHKSYYKTGVLKGIVDYSNELIEEYDDLGNLKYKAKFTEPEIHKQPTLGNYSK